MLNRTRGLIARTDENKNTKQRHKHATWSCFSYEPNPFQNNAPPEQLKRWVIILLTFVQNRSKIKHVCSLQLPLCAPALLTSIAWVCCLCLLYKLKIFKAHLFSFWHSEYSWTNREKSQCAQSEIYFNRPIPSLKPASQPSTINSNVFLCTELQLASNWYSSFS